MTLLEYIQGSFYGLSPALPFPSLNASVAVEPMYWYKMHACFTLQRFITMKSLVRCGGQEMALAEVSLAEGLVSGITNLPTGYRTQARTLRETGVSGLPIHNFTMPKIGAAFAFIVAWLTQHELTKTPDSGISLNRRDHDGGILAQGTASGWLSADEDMEVNFATPSGAEGANHLCKR